ncbi:ferrochelatase [Porphyromonadaceae bacterium W3.11]|nr:ferrochelatase [Porphyromonadaceae bacterium W3.11]
MKKGILLINTGSPVTPEVDDVKQYLTDFLTDPRVINIPYLFRHILVKGIIAPKRAPKSADKYRLIWTPEGFPLQILTDELAERMSSLGQLPVYSSMRYNRGSVDDALMRAAQDDIEELIILPLFPHYAMSSYESAVQHVVAQHKKGLYTYALKCVRPYFDHPAYIDLLVEQIATYAKSHSDLLLSYHGIPLSQTKSYLGNRDKDYEAQCNKMTELIFSSDKIQSLHLKPVVGYQSRLGNNKWLSPATEDQIRTLARDSRVISVFCPSFVCDNLETSWEIDIHERDNFIKAGGKDLTFIPCPNASAACAEVLLLVAIDGDATNATEWTKP